MAEEGSRGLGQSQSVSQKDSKADEDGKVIKIDRYRKETTLGIYSGVSGPRHDFSYQRLRPDGPKLGLRVKIVSKE